MIPNTRKDMRIRKVLWWWGKALNYMSALPRESITSDKHVLPD